MSPSRSAVSPDSTGAGAPELEHISRIRSQWNTVRQLGEIGSPSDEDLRRAEQSKKELANMKRALSTYLTSNFPLVQRGHAEASHQLSMDDSVAATWEKFLEEIVQETDAADGNTELLHAVMDRIPLDYSRVLAERGLVAMAASDGSETYLTRFLSEPHHAWDVAEVAAACFFNQSSRIPLTFMLLQFVDLEPFKGEIGDMLCEFFSDIASDRKAIPKENRALKMMLLRHVFFNMGWVSISAEREGPDGQTLFTRALYEGDADVVEMLLERQPCVITDINRRMSADGSTALMQAVLGNHYSIVASLFEKFPDVDVSVRGENGNALDLAIALGRDSRIVALLREHGAQPSGIKVDKSSASPRKIMMKVEVTPGNGSPSSSRPSTANGSHDTQTNPAAAPPPPTRVPVMEQAD
jgi:hypothetical protein